MKQTIKFTPEEAHKLRLEQNRENSSQLQVDSSLFYLDHCKKHPIDLALEKIKSYAENKNWDHNYVILGPDMFFENLDYEEKKIKKTGDWPETFWQKVFHKKAHHEWEETDREHFQHYWKMVENITIEVRNFLWKAGWEISSHKQSDNSEARLITVYF